MELEFMELPEGEEDRRSEPRMLLKENERMLIV